MPVGYRTIDGIDLNDLWYGGPAGGVGIRSAVDQYQEVDLSVVSALAMPHDNTIMKYGLGERNGFQKLAPGQRPDRKYVTIATSYPIFDKHGYGVGTDLDTMMISTGREVMIDLNRPFREDPEFVLNRFFKTMLIDPGTLNAGYGWYNGAFAPEELITKPLNFQQNTFTAGHTHYYSTNAAALVLDDIVAAKLMVTHHGITGQLVGFINSVEAARLENLAAWTGSGIRVPLRDEVAVKGFRKTFELLGVQWYVTEMMPAGYFVITVESVASEGGRPLVMFEYPNMRGLQLHPGVTPDYPLVESYFTRWMGLKVAQRGAGVAVRIGTGGTAYVNPTLID